MKEINVKYFVDPKL